MSHTLRCFFVLMVLALTGCSYDYFMRQSQVWMERAYVKEDFQVQRQANYRLSHNTKFYVPFVTTQHGVRADVPNME